MNQQPQVPGIVGSPAAVRLLEEMTRERGPLVIMLAGQCATSSVAAVRSRHGFFPHDDQTRIGKVAGCRVFADLRQIRMCPHRMIVLDVGWAGAAGEEPTFVTRAESESEYEQRVFSETSHRHV
jgi:uncharacterized protein (DUF779 family)